MARLRRQASSTARSTARRRSSPASAAVLRRLQTGSVRTYAGSLFVGVVRDPRLLPLEMSVTVLTLPLLTLLVGAAAGRRRPAAARPQRGRPPQRADPLAGARRLAGRVRGDAGALGRLRRQRRAEFQFVERVPWIPAFGIDYYVGVDGISLLLVVLTGFLTPIALLSSWEGIEKKVKEFSIFILALEAAMIGVFVSLDLFLFYVFWDAMLIPMYFLIGIWGYDQRIYAAIKFMLYTMAGSVLMLVAILGPRLPAQRGDRQLQLRPAEALRAATSRPRRSAGSSWRSRWRSPSRCRCSRSTPGCPTRTCRRRPPARSSWPACC